MSEDKDVQWLPEEQVDFQEATDLTHETTPQEIPLITNKLSILTDQDPNIMKRNNSKASNNTQNPVVFMRSICANHKHEKPVKKEHIDIENTGIVTRSKSSNTAKYTDKENRCLCFTTFDEKSVLKESTRTHRVRGDVNKRITCYNTAPVQRDFKQSVQSEEIYPLVQSHGTSYSLVQSHELLYPMVQRHGNLYPLQASKRFKPSLNLDWKYRSLGSEYKELMFPECSIANAFTLGGDKAAYFIVHDLAPFFHNNLLDRLKSCNKLFKEDKWTL
uniref:Uncharacterized protein n=1 Tax=Timema cristinae TaxID=61476 RepID=A0A7R9CQ37_TIMCR|nr:unnamed protein product [Timema cristinae]